MYRHVYTCLLATRGALWALLDFALRISWEINPSTSKKHSDQFCSYVNWRPPK